MSESYLSIYAKSFNWAGFFLPRKTYKKCSDLYDFCRVIDNIADDEEELEIKKLKFLEFKKSFFNKDLSSEKIRNMWELVNEFSISVKIIEDLFDGVEEDLKYKVQFNNQKELLIYSYKVAGTGGLMMAKILKVNSKNALMAAIELGIAMQLTNIARDVVEDRDKNRKYIEHNFQKIRQTLKMADEYYLSAFKAIKTIPVNSRFAILVARRVYREIGHKILKKKNIEDYNNSGKIYVTKIGKIKQTIFSIFDFFQLIFVKSGSHSGIIENSEIKSEINLDEKL